MSTSTMSERFHDWLDSCPCEWVRESNDGNTATYTFTEEQSGEDDDEDEPDTCHFCGKTATFGTFSYLGAGFNGIEKGNADDLGIVVCGDCDTVENLDKYRTQQHEQRN